MGTIKSIFERHNEIELFRSFIKIFEGFYLLWEMHYSKELSMFLLKIIKKDRLFAINLILTEA